MSRSARMHAVFPGLLLSGLLVGSAANAGPAGPEFRLNTYTADRQSRPVVAGVADGGFAAAWESVGQDGSGEGVYARRYDAAGQPFGTEFKVNKFTPGDQDEPDIAALAGGGFVVAWASYGQIGGSTEIYGQRYDAAAKRVGNRAFKVNKVTAAFQLSASVAGLADGGYLIVWASEQDGSGMGVYAQRYNALGNRTGKRGFRVNKHTADAQDVPCVAALDDGGFVVVWASDIQDGSGDGVYGQRYDAAGNRAGKREFRVNRTKAGDQDAPTVAGLAGGGFIVAWQSEGQDGSANGIYGQRYDAAGDRVGTREFRINKATASNQWHPDAAALEDGGFVVGWESAAQDDETTGVYGQRYDAAGKRTGPREFQVNSYSPGTQSLPGVAALGDGGFMMTWASAGQDGSDLGVYGQRYDP